ncbi:response regulator [Oleiagrimonas sp. C23AA]|uniref:response regulator n=1 Tax=Oleiagrimonas sp. C23AA TaxID=2719047 RepID=UPI0014207B84|nr:response regulator [Oleiagrimonas sp. C23AA]NII09628.1 response regulator [Oleiagrimonas sp. C23AA]
MSLDVSAGIQPFQFPTTTVLVDDHEEYLGMVPLLLDASLHVRGFNSARRALAVLGHGGSRPVPGGGWLYRWKDKPSENQELVALDVDSIHRVVYDPERFSEVSVVVVDHTMPEMDGLTFCRRLGNPHIGKILLTGRADDATAIEAFNSGLIDRFIRKSDPNAMQKLQMAIFDLQQRYFQRAAAFVSETLALGNFNFLRDPAFADVIDTMQRRFAAIECYVHANPTGLLLLDEDGHGRFLLVQTEDDLRTHFEIASDQGAPQALLDALRDGEQLAWFETRDGYYHSTTHTPLSQLHPATAVRGEQWYYYALIDQVDRFQLQHVKSYRQWLREQDQDVPSSLIPDSAG